ncbi:unnamed protein product, partial [Soboliphyme baturini]|uniref:ShKT domain-containing protein n=1 Tax=Soboliphyme baturini TaxID=241478 RepID=A0A183J2Y0_9BILA
RISLGPCVDVHKACQHWKKEGRCVWPTKITSYFLDNCPVTCGQCRYDSKTVPHGPPLPPFLEPFTDLVGKWVPQKYLRNHFAIDLSSEKHYKEEYIKFEINDMPLFDHPSLNYTSKAISEDDTLEEYGFLTLSEPKKPHRSVGLIFITNTGLSVMQEGYIDGGLIKLTTVYNVQYEPSAARSKYLTGNRTLQWSNGVLMHTYNDDKGYQYNQVYTRSTKR